jgi:FkbM family methyltransferase
MAIVKNAIPKIRTFIRIAKLCGLQGMGRFWLQYMTRADPFSLPISEIRRDLWLRRHNSDLDVLWEVFGERECDITLPGTAEPRFIIDGGAYAGYTTAYFAHRYPNARIVAIEPDPGNFNLLRKNCAPCENVTLINSALWSSSANLTLANSTPQSWSVRVREPQSHETGPVRGVTIPDLLQRFGVTAIDILKLDIEGAECEIFSNENDGWLERVHAIIIETHGKSCEDAVAKSTATHGFIATRKGEKKVLVKPPRDLAHG